MAVPIIATAQAFLQERCGSLIKDVRHCVLHDRSTPDWPAPFPALLYCFSTIDLLGALYGGNAASPNRISQRSRQYMMDVMGYSLLQANLLQQVFRHKLVHLAQPRPRAQHGGVTYVWGYHHNDRSIHLQVKPGGGVSEFWVSIMSLAEDIQASVFRSGGYLDRLRADPALQAKFQKAYNEITI